MGSYATLQAAKSIVQTISEKLERTAPEQLPSVRSVFITGSYLRGDWLEASSDLDLGVLFHGGSAPACQESDLRYLHVLAGNCAFPSHTPGGIDWNTQMFLPTIADAGVVGPYFPYSVFLFDLVQNMQILWGEDFQAKLPQALDPRGLSLAAITYLCVRASGLATESAETERRLAFAGFKATQILQLHYGERTLNKVRLLELYRQHVPPFELKAVGELLIRDFYGASYPDRAPAYRDAELYRSFLNKARALLNQ